MKLTIKIDSGHNSAFTDDPIGETLDIVSKAIMKLDGSSEQGFPIRDTNGNTVGRLAYVPTEQQVDEYET